MTSYLLSSTTKICEDTQEMHVMKQSPPEAPKGGEMRIK